MDLRASTLRMSLAPQACFHLQQNKKARAEGKNCHAIKAHYEQRKSMKRSKINSMAVFFEMKGSSPGQKQPEA